MTSTASVQLDTRQRWSRWTMVALERLPLPYPFLVLLVGLAILAEQGLEYWLYPSYAPTTSRLVVQALVYPLVAVYILTHLRILKRNAIRALIELRPAVLIGDEDYDQHVRRMVHADGRTELALLAVTLVLVAAIFWGTGVNLLDSAVGPAVTVPAAVLIFGSYVLLGWLVLTLVYCSIRHARELRALARRPLLINVFDPANLLPFGRLSLLHSLPSVGVMLIPLVFWGLPTKAGYLVILLSMISLLSLFVPLWGVHEQIDRAKERALSTIYLQLQGVQDEIFRDLDAVDPAHLKALADRTGTLIHLKKVIQESPNWPFKDTAAAARAALAVSSPLIYFVLNELIRAFFLPLVTP